MRPPTPGYRSLCIVQCQCDSHHRRRPPVGNEFPHQPVERCPHQEKNRFHHRHGGRQLSHHGPCRFQSRQDRAPDIVSLSQAPCRQPQRPPSPFHILRGQGCQ